MRICVAGVRERVAGARFTGRYVFTGLPAGRAADVTVDALDAGGAVLAQWRGAQVWGYSEGGMGPAAPTPAGRTARPAPPRAGWPTATPGCSACASPGRSECALFC
ncbi:MAG: hypothetical protein H6740_25210 [Alphaproteobacteria bacterium]|nr:hypothetical protein [Alphaproteobacteria bacterium]